MTRRRPVRKISLGRFAVYAVLLLLALFAIGPILLFAFNALKTQSELATDPLGVPFHPQWHNFLDAWQQANMGVGLRNSAVVVISTALGVCVISGCAAYAMSRLRVPGSNFFIFYLLVTTSLPIQLFLVPLFYLWPTSGCTTTCSAWSSSTGPSSARSPPCSSARSWSPCPRSTRRPPGSTAQASGGCSPGLSCRWSGRVS
jgi:ABC-type glycerol-3-phosphate transport system permease component